MQAAKTVASTIRSVQPAIQELNQATTDIRTSITKEVGLDSLQKEFREIEKTTRDSLRLDTPSFTPLVPGPTPDVLTGAEYEGAAGEKGKLDGATRNGVAEAETLTAIAEDIRKDGNQTVKDGLEEGSEDIQKMRAESAAMAWAGSTSQAQMSEVSTGESVKKRLEDMTMAELQGELARRKEMIERINNLN
jgi:hypothetical protein